MYEIALSFTIVSQNPRIGRVLRSVPPLEDCVYHFFTCPNCDGLSPASVTDAVIFGSDVPAGDIASALEGWQEGAPLTAVIAEAGQAALPAELCRRVDCL